MKTHKKVKGFLKVGINITFETIKKRFHFKCNKCNKLIPSKFSVTLPESNCMRCAKKGDFAFYQHIQDSQLEFEKYAKKDKKYQKRITI